MSAEDSVERMLKRYYHELGEHEASHLFATLRDIASKAEVDLPSVHWQKPNATASPATQMMDYLVGVLPTNKGKALVLGHKLTELFGFSNPSSTISKEMKSVLFHEMAHAKYNDNSRYKVAMASPMLCAAAAVGGLAFYDHYKKKQKAKKEEQEKAAPNNSGDPLTDTTLPGEKGYSQEQEKKNRKHPFGWAVTVAKYMAASAIGLTAGVFMFRAIHHHAEYRADRFSKQQMGSGEPLAGALEKLRDVMHQRHAATEANMRANGTSESEISRMKKVIAILENMMHPPINKRIDRLREM